MDRFVIALLASALGATAGVLVTKAASSDKAPAGEQTAETLADDVSKRLELIEAKLDDRPEPLTLRGTPPPAAKAFTPDSPEGKALVEAVAVRVAEKAKEEAAEAPATVNIAGGTGRRSRKRLKLTDVAREMELSSAEEQALREAYQKTNDKVLKMLAGEDGDIEEVKRDLEKLRENPEEGMAIMGKYMPRVMKNPAPFFMLRGEQNKSVEEAIGKDKARELNRDFVVEESDPFGMGRGGRRGFGGFGGR